MMDQFWNMKLIFVIDYTKRVWMFENRKIIKMVKNGKKWWTIFYGEWVKMSNDFYGERGFQNVKFHHFSPLQPPPPQPRLSHNI